MKFRKKPVVIEAVLFQDTAESLSQISDFSKSDISVSYEEPEHPYLKIHTLEGTMVAQPGDWIIKGVKGEFYPCKPDIFAATYVEEGAPPDYQQRVKIEKAELDDKISRLRSFHETPVYMGLPGSEQYRLTAQLGIMESYSEILHARIEAFPA